MYISETEIPIKCKSASTDVNDSLNTILRFNSWSFMNIDNNNNILLSSIIDKTHELNLICLLTFDELRVSPQDFPGYTKIFVGDSTHHILSTQTECVALYFIVVMLCFNSYK